MKKALIFMAIFSLVILNCSKKTITNNYYSSHDLISSVSPYDGAEQVDLDERIRIRFQREMDRESVQKAFHIEPMVEGQFSWYDYRPSGSLELRFTPRDQFATNTRYQVTIDTTASDIAGIKLLKPYQFSFTTEPVRIVSTYPRHNDAWVSPTTYIRISFNTDMDMESVISALKIVDSELNDVIGNFSWSNRRQMKFYPISALAANEEHTVAIDTTASDTKGARLSEPYQFSFTTEAIGIEYTSPRHNNTWVSPNTKISIRFNTDMDMESVASAFKMVDSELNDVMGNFVVRSQQWMEFQPNSALAVDETYTVTIDTTASDTKGARLSEPYQFSFTTQPLLIVSTKPKHKDTWVSPDSCVRISFNTDMDMESANSAFKMVDSEQKEVSGGFVWEYPTQMEFYPDSVLAFDETYTVTIDTKAKDMHGKALSNSYNFWFKTRPY
ncbi:MAG: Ig-like domain-containing protein [candidate division Zixibacteria bacterium]|nr:Ig-like domain-containing protein [candidate division Zixibacteria bacterium]